MQSIQNSIETIKKALNYHRKMVVIYFAILIFVFIGFISVELLSKRYEYDSIIRIATALNSAPKNINLHITSERQIKPFLPDSASINLNEISDIEITVTVPVLILTVFIIFAIYGLLRYHLKRVNIAEDRLYFMEKIVPLIENDTTYKEEVIKSLIDYEQNFKLSTSNVTNFHPVQEIVENLIDALSSFKNSINKNK